MKNETNAQQYLSLHQGHLLHCLLHRMSLLCYSSEGIQNTRLCECNEATHAPIVRFPSGLPRRKLLAMTELCCFAPISRYPLKQ